MKSLAATKEDLATYDGQFFEVRPVLHAASHAMAVYGQKYRDLAHRAGFSRAMLIDEGCTEVGIAASPTLIVIAARGTSSIGDGIEDLLAHFRVGWSAVLPKGLRVGYGYKRQTRRAGPQILQRLRGLLVPGISDKARIVVTGHSLGAPIANLLACYLRSQGVRVDLVLALESPRVGSRKFCAWYDFQFTNGATPTRSIVNVFKGRTDLVTRLPKSSWGFGDLGVRDVLADGKVLDVEAWEAHRAAHPVTSNIAAWRIISRLWENVEAGIQAHRGAELISTLEAMDGETGN